MLAAIDHGPARLAAILLCLAAVPAVTARANSNEPIEPLPRSVAVDAAKAMLGKQLFHDSRLSRNDTISCASCHDVSNWGVDSSSSSTGFSGQVGSRNAPTVFNAVFNFRQFWDGRAATLSAQAAGPVVDPIEMGMESWDAVVEKLRAVPEYRTAFEQVYGDDITAEAIRDAIAEYEKTLITADSPFDRYLRGDEKAITPQQLRGYRLFKGYGCVSCHQGRNVGGNMFQKFGVLKDINLRKAAQVDFGRFNVTGNEWDKHVFKVPSLRLATKTAPYFHDGSVATLEEAVRIMVEFQLGRPVPARDQQDIIAFLESLVGTYTDNLR